MASARYTVNNLPVGANAAAFMPTLTRSPKSSSYAPVNRAMVGHPGDQAIASPKPNWTPDGPLMRSAQPSYSSPDIFYPDIYYIRVAKQTIAGGVTYLNSTHELPVPATANNPVPMVGFTPAKIGGYKQIEWPPATPVWQSVNSPGV